MSKVTRQELLKRMKFTSYDVTYCEGEGGKHYWKVERKERGKVISTFECETMLEAKRVMNRSQAAMMPEDGGVIALVAWHDGGYPFGAKMIRHMEKVEV